MFDRGRSAGGDAAVVGEKTDGFFAIGPDDGREGGFDGDLDFEFLVEFADEGGFRGFAGVDLSAREFPEAGEVFSGGALAGEDFAGGVGDDAADDVDHGGGRVWG